MTSLTAIFVTFLAQYQVFLLCFGAIHLYNGAGILDVISTDTFEKYKLIFQYLINQLLGSICA